MLAVVGTLTYEFQVVLPLLARSSFDGGAGTYGLLTSAMGAGAIVGGLVAASRGGTGLRSLTLAAAAFGTSVLVTAAAPTAGVAVAALFVVGATSVTFLATGNTTLQLAADPRFRGPGDGPLGRRLPRQHASRRAHHRRGLGAPQPARRPRHRRGRLPRSRRPSAPSPAPGASRPGSAAKPPSDPRARICNGRNGDCASSATRSPLRAPLARA